MTDPTGDALAANKAKTSDNSLVVLESITAAVIFAERGCESIIDAIRKEVAKETPDISTKKGRERIASLAFKVSQSKVAIDNLGENLVKDWKTKAKAVDIERKRMREELDQLRDEVRAPLTAWENAEKDRVAAHESELRIIQEHRSFGGVEPTVEEIKARLAFIQNHSRKWEEFERRATDETTIVINALKTRLTMREAADAERAELVRLRQEDADRKKREEEQRIADKAKKEAEEIAEKRRLEDLRLANEREEKIKADAEKAANEAAEALRLSAEREAKTKREAEEAAVRAQKAESDRIAAQEAARLQAIETAKKVEREKQEAEEAAVKRERERIELRRQAEAEETAKRVANEKHRNALNAEAAKAIGDILVSAHLTNLLLEAIVEGKIPHVKIIY